MAMIREKFIVLLAVLSSAQTVNAEESAWDFAADVGLQSRFFGESALWPGQSSESAQYSIEAMADLSWSSSSGNQRASFIPFVRWDNTDSERSVVDLREAYWAFDSDTAEILIGVNTVFWGVTESVHLVDIINQTDAVADIDGEGKLGQPMVNLDLQRDWGLVSLYVMPFFRERTFAGVDGRLRTPIPVDSERPQYESSDGRNNVDLAIRYSHYFGDIDLGVSVFDGTSREPRLLPAADSATLLPYYDQITQLGLDVQYTREAWLWKLETIVRDGYSETFAAAVAGFEYTFYQLGGSSSDIGVLLEYQYDGRSRLEPITIADNDIFAGARLAMNDIQDTTVLAGVGFDVETSETFVNVEAQRRFGDDFVLEIRLRGFSGASPRNLTYALSNDSYLQLQLSKYF